ncbi:anti-sigma factor [Chloroflexus sp.]|uniref:anti-sigma factor n=1 Tax=Chloroflexus sp. TaxID=1904827 RepID=UPI00261D9542|nr:anti-sigma factor [uncultured Chloroflexus sp.]
MSAPLSTPPPDELLDAALRHELRWEAPPELTSRLLQLVPGTSITAPDPAPLPRWRFYLAVVLIVVTALVSIIGASYLYQLVWFQLGADYLLAQLEALPARLLQMVYDTMPFARELIGVIALIRDQLHWLLLALILWILLDQRQSEGRLAHNGQS